MGVYINGMDKETAVRICAYAGLRMDDSDFVFVPYHGRLIDADALEKDIDKYIGGEESRSRFHHWVQVQRTVIPESEEAHT